MRSVGPSSFMEESAVAKPRRTPTPTPTPTPANTNTNGTTTTTVATADRTTPEPVDGEDAGSESEEEVWEMLSTSFRRVQSVLDRNRTLISQVNENHQSKVSDNLARNVGLIQEINGNISKVLSIYSDLSVNFSGVVHQRRALQKGAGGRNGEKLESSEA